MSAAEPEWRQWLAKADNDLLNIQNNLASREIPWDTMCFHAQQAAEKMFKALIVHDGGTPNRTHDLIFWRPALPAIPSLGNWKMIAEP